MLFCSFCFPDAKTRGAYFSASKTIASGLTGQHLPLSILFSYQSHNLQQDNSFLSGASRPTPSCPTSLQSPTPPPDHQHIPSGASRPIPPATILSIPAPQSSISQLPSSRLGRPTPYIPSYHFFNIHKASSSHQVSLPTILLKSTNKNLSKTSSRRISVIFPDITTHHSTHLLFSIFPFSISSPTSSRPSSFRTSNSNLIPHFPNAIHFFRSAAASPTRRPNAKRSFARGCSLQGCRWCGRGARVSFFHFFLFFSASLFSLSFLISLAPRLRRDAFIFLFAFLHIFVFYFCFFFLFLFLLLFLSLPSLFFLFVFLLSFYLCFFFSFFCLSFCFTFLPSLLQSLSSLSNRSPTIHFFYSAANLSYFLQPLPGSSKKKKISAKESTGERWPHGSERAAGGKAEGQDGMN